MDYEKFWDFPPEVHDITVAAGHRWWQTQEGLADTYPCPPCKPGAQALAHGGHDTVSLLLGKPDAPVTPQHFERLVGMVNEANAIWQKKKHQGHSHSPKKHEVAKHG